MKCCISWNNEEAIYCQGKKRPLREEIRALQKGYNTMTREELEAMASYLTSHRELRGELRAYLKAPADKKKEILALLWERHGDKIRAKL